MRKTAIMIALLGLLLPSYGAAQVAELPAGEMDEIASTFEDNGLPDGFHRGAADIYRRLADFKDHPNAPDGAELARYLLPPSESELPPD